MKIGDRCFVYGYVDEIRKDTVIVRNKGGYFGTDPGEVITVYDTTHPNWILCSKTVDTPKDDVLCCCKDGEIVIGVLSVLSDGCWLCESDSGVIFDAVAWMPLPEPYKERREE